MGNTIKEMMELVNDISAQVLVVKVAVAEHKQLEEIKEKRVAFLKGLIANCEVVIAGLCEDVKTVERGVATLVENLKTIDNAFVDAANGQKVELNTLRKKGINHKMELGKVLVQLNQKLASARSDRHKLVDEYHQLSAPVVQPVKAEVVKDHVDVPVKTAYTDGNIGGAVRIKQTRVKVVKVSDVDIIDAPVVKAKRVRKAVK